MKSEKEKYGDGGDRDRGGKKNQIPDPGAPFPTAEEIGEDSALALLPLHGGDFRRDPMKPGNFRLDHVRFGNFRCSRMTPGERGRVIERNLRRLETGAKEQKSLLFGITL